MILFTNVTKIFDNGTEALKEVSFYVERGEFVFVIGSSGAGKSTITKLIMREELPTEGGILINNTDITKIPRSELPYYRRKLGVVFQDFRLLPGKTVFENVAFALQVIGAPKREVRRKVPAVLNLVGLAHKAKVRVTELSGGEQQRVSLARAIINNPPVLLCDEPTGNLDPVTALEIMQILNQINKSGTTILLVTHASDIVDMMKKRVIEIQDGIIVRDQKQGVYSA
ncbi:MAG: cell division ATP-binding protein FtsE [Clostridiales bacterium]|nr:cell division ATP-binding protein FtsE [Clostridiales bacterium]